jgi:hypothetical protein
MFLLFWEEAESIGDRDSTKNGSLLFSKSPRPNWPLKFSPQEYSSPSVDRAKECSDPQEISSNSFVVFSFLSPLAI